jgi:hypothetical protein
MNILIYKNDQQHGPYSREDIEEHLKSGAFTRDDPAWMDGQSHWKPLSEVLGGSAPKPPPNAAASSVSKTFTESFFEKATATARLTQKQAYRKKLELIELRQAHYLLGKKAHENGLSLPDNAEITSQIDTLRGEITALRQEAESKPSSSLADKAKGAANAATKAAKVEALTLKHNHLLTELGSKLRENPNADPALSPEIDASKVVCMNIAMLDAEIEKLASKTYRWARNPFLMVGILVALLIAYVGYGWVRGGAYSQWGAERELHQIKDQVAKEQMRIAAELAELQRKEVEDRKKDQQEREVQIAQEKLDQQKREVERQQESRARQAQADTEKRRREMEREEQQRQKMQTAVENAQKDEIAKKQEQQLRSVFAADRFSRISISPRAAISATLKRLNVSVELRGKDIETLQSLLQQRDYLKLVGYLCDRPYTDYPPVSEIEDALRELARKDFSILLKTTSSEIRDNELYLISFPDDEYTIVSSSSSWERHPDGIGYLHEWSLSDGPVIVLAGDYETVQNPIRSFNESARTQCEALKKKKELGEIDEGAYQARVVEVRKATYDAILKWALSR